jgi:hypothetical protein
MDEKLKEKIIQLAKEAEVYFGEPLSKEEIERMESKLGLTLPKEYKEFLETFGCIERLEVLGSCPKRLKKYRHSSGEELWSALGLTLSLREDYSTFPKNCVAIMYDQHSGYYCVVCGGKDHGKVIYWNPWCDPEQAYPNIPKPEWFEENPDWAQGHLTGKKEDFWVEGLDFWSWLIKTLEENAARIKKEKEMRKGE